MLELIAVPMFRRFVPYFSKMFSIDELRKAGLNYTVEEWISMALFSSFITSILSFFLIFIFSFLFYNISFSLIFSLSGAIFLFGVVFLIYKMYPEYLIKKRKKKIDNSIHYAALYMSTVAGSGAPPQEIFNVLSKMRDLSEISKISTDVVRDMNVFGLSLSEALEREARYSPSEKMKEMLWGIKTIITSGGDLQNYLLEKGRRYLNEYKRSLEDYSHTMSMLVEIYTTVVIVGAIFAIVLSSLMGTISGFTPSMKFFQYATLLLGLPLSTLIFILVIKMISPSEV